MAKYHPLSLAVLPIFHSINGTLIQALFHQFGFDCIMGNCVKDVLKVELYNIHYSPLIQSQEGNQVGPGWFFLGKPMFHVQISFLSLLCLDLPLKGLRLSWLRPIDLLLDLLENACNICLYLIIRTLTWWSWPFKDDRERFQVDIDQLFQHSWMIPWAYESLTCLSGPWLNYLLQWVMLPSPRVCYSRRLIWWEKYFLLPQALQIILVEALALLPHLNFLKLFS